jgi:hypothetical protein
MQRGTLVALMTLIAAVVMTIPGEAEARRRIIFYQSGEDIFASGPLPAPFDKDKQYVGAQAGYKCQIFGIFWAYLHIWNCQAVAMKGNQYSYDPKLAAAIDAKYEGKMNVGLWTKHGRWVFAVIVLLAIVGYFRRGRKKRRAREEEAAEAMAG